MPHIDRVDSLMQGVPMGDLYVARDRASQERYRSIAIPVGRQVVWAVYDPESLAGHIVHHEETAYVTLFHSVIEGLRRGKVKTQTQLFNVSLGPCDSLPAEKIPAGHKAVMIARKILSPVQNFGGFHKIFEFNDTGMLVSGTCASRGSYQLLAEEYDVYMDNMQGFYNAVYPPAIASQE